MTWAEAVSLVVAVQRGYKTVTVGLALCPLLILVLDAFRHGSLLLQYCYLAAFAAAFVVAVVGADRFISHLLALEGTSSTSSPTRASTIVRGAVTKALKNGFFRGGSKVEQEHTKLSPKRKREILKTEVDKWFHTMMKLYVQEWTRLISADQRLDEEVGDDLYEAIHGLATKITKLPWDRFTLDVSLIVHEHVSKLARRPGSSGKRLRLDDCFQYTHPVNALRLDRDAYLLEQSRAILHKFGVRNVISSPMAFDCLSKIFNTQVTKTLVDTLLDPLAFLSEPTPVQRGAKEALVRGLGSPQVSYLRSQSDNTHKSSCKKVSTKRGQRTASAETSDTNVGSNQTWNRATLDLTGYSVRPRDKVAESFPVRESSGKISTALGGLFSATAGPLLPDNIGFKSFNKMWRSQSTDDLQSGSKPQSPSRSPDSSTFFSDGRLTSTFRRQSLFSRRAPSVDLLDVRSHSSSASPATGPNRQRPHIRDIYPPQDQRRHSIHSSSDYPVSSGEAHEVSAAIRRLVRQRSQVDGDDDPDGGNKRVEEPLTIESNDLATTIGKLRSVLEEKASINIRGEGETSRNEAADGLHLAGSLTEDGRLITNISIPEPPSSSLAVGIPIRNVASKIDEGLPPYDIHYDGLYLQSTSSSAPSPVEPDSRRKVGVCYRYVVKHRVVKRRFQEFLSLQRRLEDDSRSREAVKGIMGPEKLVSNATFTRQTQQSLDLRRVFLEKWLECLCSQPPVTTSPAFQDFLAYADVKAIADRDGEAAQDDTYIDKFLSRTMSGVFHTIKDVLPSFDDDSGAHSGLSLPTLLTPNKPSVSLNLMSSSPTSTTAGSMPDGIFGKKPTVPYKVQFKFRTCEIIQGHRDEARLSAYVEKFDREWKKSTTDRAASTDTTLNTPSNVITSLLKITSFKRSLGSAPERTAGSVLTDICLVITETFLEETTLTTDFVAGMCQALLGPAIDDIIARALDLWMRDDMAWALHLKHLRRLIWEVDGNEADETGATGTKGVPVGASHLLGKLNLGEKARRLQTWISDKDINADVVLKILDLFLVYILEEEEEALRD